MSFNTKAVTGVSERKNDDDLRAKIVQVKKVVRNRSKTDIAIVLQSCEHCDNPVDAAIAKLIGPDKGQDILKEWEVMPKRKKLKEKKTTEHKSKDVESNIIAITDETQPKSTDDPKTESSEINSPHISNVTISDKTKDDHTLTTNSSPSVPNSCQSLAEELNKNTDCGNSKDVSLLMVSKSQSATHTEQQNITNDNSSQSTTDTCCTDSQVPLPNKDHSSVDKKDTKSHQSIVKRKDRHIQRKPTVTHVIIDKSHQTVKKERSHHLKIKDRHSSIKRECHYFVIKDRSLVRPSSKTEKSQATTDRYNNPRLKKESGKDRHPASSPTKECVVIATHPIQTPPSQSPTKSIVSIAQPASDVSSMNPKTKRSSKKPRPPKRIRDKLKMMAINNNPTVHDELHDIKDDVDQPKKKSQMSLILHPEPSELKSPELLPPMSSDTPPTRTSCDSPLIATTTCDDSSIPLEESSLPHTPPELSPISSSTDSGIESSPLDNNSSVSFTLPTDEMTSEDRQSTTEPSLRKLIKDLHRCDISLTRYQQILQEKCDLAAKNLERTFTTLKIGINARQEDLNCELQNIRQTAALLLQRRKATAISLRKLTESANQLEECQLVELKKQLKNFVSDRKVDESVGTLNRFYGDPDDILPSVMKFGKMISTQETYSSWNETPLSAIEKCSIKVSLGASNTCTAPNVPSHHNTSIVPATQYYQLPSFPPPPPPPISLPPINIPSLSLPTPPFPTPLQTSLPPLCLPPFSFPPPLPPSLPPPFSIPSPLQLYTAALSQQCCNGPSSAPIFPTRPPPTTLYPPTALLPQSAQSLNLPAQCKNTPEYIAAIQERVRHALYRQGVCLYNPFTGKAIKPVDVPANAATRVNKNDIKKKTPTQQRRERKKRQKERQKREKLKAEEPPDSQNNKVEPTVFNKEEPSLIISEEPSTVTSQSESNSPTQNEVELPVITAEEEVVPLPKEEQLPIAIIEKETLSVTAIPATLNEDLSINTTSPPNELLVPIQPSE